MLARWRREDCTASSPPPSKRRRSNSHPTPPADVADIASAARRLFPTAAPPVTPNDRARLKHALEHLSPRGVRTVVRLIAARLDDWTATSAHSTEVMLQLDRLPTDFFRELQVAAAIDRITPTRPGVRRLRLSDAMLRRLADDAHAPSPDRNPRLDALCDPLLPRAD